jgi:hypothetical protein
METMSIRVMLLALATVDLAAAATEADFGLLGIAGFENAAADQVL